MPRKYRTLIPLLEGEEFDYSNDMNFMDDAIPSDRLPKYFEVSTGDYDVVGDITTPSVAENVQRALSCYQLRTSGTQVQVVEDAKYTAGAIVLRSGVHLVPGRYECRVMFPKKSSSVFSFRLYGKYTDGARGVIDIITPNNAVDGNMYNNIHCYTYNNMLGTMRASKVCTISKNLNDGNFHTIGWDWYYSENHKCVKFYIDNTELTTLDVAPSFPLVLYVACIPDPSLSSTCGDFDYDYAEVDYIRFTAFANQAIDTSGTFREDTYRGGDITETVSDNVVIPRILLSSYHGGSEVVVSKVTKAEEEIIVRNFNQGDKKFTIDTNGNRDAYEYGTYSATVESKITVPSVVEATINGKRANYPVITNARAKLNKIEGNSIVWNQLCPNFKETINGQLRQCWSQDGGTMTITEEDGEQVATLMASDPTGVTFRLRPYVSTANNANPEYMRNLPPRYHKVLFKFDARAEGTDTYDWGNWLLYICNYDANNPRFTNTMKSGEWTTFKYIQELTLGDMTSCFFNPSVTWTSGLEGKDIGYSMRRVMVFDLTLMFGKGNEPTIEEFNRMFPNTYYPWVAEGELRKTHINSIKSYDKDGNELDSINLPSEVLNKDYISSSLNSQYHNGFQVTNRLKLDSYKYDGADFLGIEEFYKVKSVDLGNYNWSKGTNNYYSFYSSALNSAALNSDMGYEKYSCVLCPVLSSTSPSKLANNTTTTNHNKAISFSGNAGGLYVYDSQYADAAALKTGLTGVNAYIGMSTATQYNNDITNYLYFDDISLQIAEGGYIEVDYTGFAPNISFDFPVQLYRIYEASYGKVDVVALDSQLQNAKYNTSLQLDTIKGRSVKWTQLVDKSNLVATTTKSGITFTNNGNGTYTLNGTATELVYLHITGFDALQGRKYLLKGCPSGGSADTYKLYVATDNTFGGIFDYGSGTIKQCLEDGHVVVTIEVAAGYTCNNVIFRPQVFNLSDIYGLGNEPATIADFNKDYPYSIYPYGKQEILTTKVSGIKIRAGYKNLLKTFANTTTISGVTITNNNDGTYTANGTATEDINFLTASSYPVKCSADRNYMRLLIQGCPANGSLDTYCLRNNWSNTYDTGNGYINVITFNSLLDINPQVSIIIKQGTTCNNLVFKPELINLTDTYGVGNEPKTVAQFNQDFPNIDNMPYPDTEITFDEQTLYGINDVQDTLQVIKENDGYKLQKVENIGNVDMGTLDFVKSTSEENNFFRTELSNGQVITEDTTPNILCSNYITTTKRNVWGNLLYNLMIGEGENSTTKVIELDIRDDNSWRSMTAEEFKNSLLGQTLYYALANPTTTTLATLIKSQVTALFAKGYCVEILGNDDNRIIVRPDLSLKIPTDLEEIVTTIDLDDQDVSDTNIKQEDTTTENFDENESNVEANEIAEESTSD